MGRARGQATHSYNADRPAIDWSLARHDTIRASIAALEYRMQHGGLSRQDYWIEEQRLEQLKNLLRRAQ